MYLKLLKEARELSTGIPTSPIDVLRKLIKDAGYETVEATGRGTMFELSDDLTKGRFVNNDRPDKIGAFDYFNNNPGVVLLMNRSGSTGVDAHSKPTFKDTSQRVPYFIQNDFDINVVVQSFGRFNRADQLNKPEYNFVVSPVPAEMRNMMMLARKLKSLDANTTGNQSHSKSMMDVPDFMNKYGDEVVVEYLNENPEINDMLGDPLSLGGEDTNKENAAYRVTGKMQILPSELQERMYREIIDRYTNYIDYLNATGQNDLHVESVDLKAEVKNSEVSIYGNGGFSAFGENSILNTAEVNRLRRPLKQKELKAMLAEVPDDHVDRLKAKMEADLKKSEADAKTEITQRYDDYRKRKRDKIEEKKGLTREEKDKLYAIEKSKLDEEESNRIQSIEATYEARSSILRRYMDFFYPGRVLEIPYQEKEQLSLIRMNKGVFVSFDVNMKKKNPWALSNVMLKFATLDSRRIFRIPASKMQHIDSIIGNSYQMTEQEAMDVLERWDYMQPEKDREIRFIVTGNILQAMNTYPTGKLIQFTMSDGTVDVGILLPDNWIKPDTKHVKIPINRAYDIVMALRSGESIADTSGDVTIRRSSSDVGEFEFIVPESHKRGKQYWGNERIKSIVIAGRFDTRGGKMVARFPDTRLKEMLDYLNERFRLQIEADNNQVGRAMSQGAHAQTMQEYGVDTQLQRGVDPKVESHVNNVPGKEGRVHWDAIPDEKPKTFPEIIAALSRAMGKDILFVNKPTTRRAAGAYSPGTGRVGIAPGYNQNIDVIAHEIGHYLDDKFGILGPQSFHIWNMLKPELSQLWKFGSKPPRGAEDPDKYRMAEGMAEFIRAWVVNPTETERRFPITFDWFKSNVEQHKGIWEGLKQFSHDIRVYAGSSALDKIGATLVLDMSKGKKGPMAFSRYNKEGQWRMTAFDNVAKNIYYFLDPLVEAYKEAMRQHGITKIHDPNQLNPKLNFEIMARNHLGVNVKLANMNENGIMDFDQHYIVDPVTKQNLTWNFLMSRIPSDSLSDYRENLEYALKVGVSQRAVEIPELRARRLMRWDLKNSEKIPPPELLFNDRNEDIYQRFKEKIDKIVDAVRKGDLEEEDAFFEKKRYDFRGIVITGAGQDGMADYELALQATKEFEELKQTDPYKYKWVNEFWRVYRLMAWHWVEYAVDSHLLDRETADIIHEDNLYYVGFQRIMELEAKDIVEGNKDVPGIFSSGGYVAPTRDIWAVMGSDKPIGNPISNLMRSWGNMVVNGDANYIVNTFANAFQWVDYKDPMTGKKHSRNMYDGPPPNFGEIVTISKTPEKHSVVYWTHGKRRYLVFHDKDVWKVWQELMPSQGKKDHWALQFFQILPKAVRKSIILAAPFMLRNIVRDMRHLFVIGEGLGYLYEDIGPHEPWNKLFEKYGGGQFGFVLRDRTAYDKLVENMIFEAADDPKKYFVHPIKAMKKLHDILFKYAELSERPTRLVQFIAAYKEGIIKYHLSPVEAGFRAAYIARDLLDFAAAGLMVKEFNKYAPFTSAAVRGLERDVRAGKQKPGKFLLMMLLGPVMSGIINSALIALFGSDEMKDEYKNMPQYRRDMFNFIPLGNSGRWLIIPKPFEIGAIASVFQRVFDYYVLDDKNAFGRGYLRNVWHLFMPYDIPGITGGYGGLFAIATNRDYFRQKYIIPPSEQDIELEHRNTESASKFGQAIQKASGWDARYVDAFVNKQLPYYGNYLLKIMETIIPGEPNPKFKFNVLDTGFVINAPAFNSPDANYVFRTFKKNKQTIHDVAPGLEKLVLNETYLWYKQFYDPKTQKDPELMRRLAAQIRGFYSTVAEAIEPIDWKAVRKNDASIKKAMRKIRGY